MYGTSLESGYSVVAAARSIGGEIPTSSSDSCAPAGREFRGHPRAGLRALLLAFHRSLIATSFDSCRPALHGTVARMDRTRSPRIFRAIALACGTRAN